MSASRHRDWYEPISNRRSAALGNFPLVFTHIGLILAARECGIGQECE